MSISKLIRGALEAKLGALRAEKERLLQAADRLAEVDTEMAEIEVVLADADSGKPAQVPVAARNKPVAVEPAGATLPTGKTP